jgi:hypothetical protein
MRTILAAALLVLPAEAYAADLGPLKLASDDAVVEGRQVQSPVWAPGDSPKLVHELTDRDKSTILRVVDLSGEAVVQTLVPGARSSRMESLGAGSERADSKAVWWDDSSFFFVRAEGGGSDVYYFDGIPKKLSVLPGRVEEIAADHDRGYLFVALEDAGGLDLHRLSGDAFSGDRRRLTRTEHQVETSIAVEPVSGTVHFVRTSSDGTGLGVVGVEDLQARTDPANAALRSFELLSARAVPGTSTLLFYARVPAGAPENEARHVLIELTDGKVKLLQGNAFLPPGLAPPPAMSHGGRYVYYVLSDAQAGNPIQRYDRQTGKATSLKLGTRGNQEVAVADYPGVDGARVPWVAVVSVGDDSGQDVRNHLYAGPVPVP